LAGGAAAQVVRFETTMGNFDMVLNPTHNSKLQAHVDNMVDYVQRQSYKGSWINRADTGFVLQMGGFYSMTKRPPMTSDSVRSIQSFAPVPGEPAQENPGLSNTIGTVSLALSGNQSGTNQDSGTTSFFVNLGDNSGLDSDFTVFAAIPDMTVVNQIMALSKLDRTKDPAFGISDPKNLTFTTVPLQTDGKQVFIMRAFVVGDAMTIVNDTSKVQAIMAQSAASFAADGGSASAGLATNFSTPAALVSNVVPEPTSIGLAVIALASLAAISFRRRR
jgi:cyclophilin family peptidyl-prolyl cis-trans isomerase